MTNEDNGSEEPKAAAPARIIFANRSQKGVARGHIEIVSSTKHGDTALMAVKPPGKLEAGEALVTDAWVLGSRNFVVVGEHTKPMKIPGNWYVVRITQPKT